MQTTKITDNLIQLTRYRFVNAFLVREDDGFTLVDTTMPRTGDQLTEAARRAGAPITRIALGSLEVIASPWHSPGHVSFLDTRDSSLIAGDVFTTIGTAAVSDHFYWRFPFAAMATYDKARELESARALEPILLAVGHRRPVAAPATAIDAAIRHAGR